MNTISCLAVRTADVYNEISACSQKAEALFWLLQH